VNNYDPDNKLVWQGFYTSKKSKKETLKDAVIWTL